MKMKMGVWLKLNSHSSAFILATSSNEYNAEVDQLTLFPFYLKYALYWTYST